MDTRSTSRRETWKRLLDQEIGGYRLGIQTFSTPHYRPAQWFGEVVRREVRGKCLDIGCGILHRPAYHKGTAYFWGIDPHPGEERAFPFVRGVGEALPFKSGAFDAALFGTSLEHTLMPLRCLSEAVRVLKPGGKLLVWFADWSATAEGHAKYQLWCARGGMFDTYHQWAFTMAELVHIMTDLGLYVYQRLNWNKSPVVAVIVGRKERP